MTTKRLSKVVSSEALSKAESHNKQTEIYHLFQKGDLWTGQNRVYTPDKDGDKVLPPESKKVAMTVKGQMEGYLLNLGKFLNDSATRDWGNCTAKADIIVDGDVILKDVPTTFLLFLDKQLNDMKSMVSKMPVLDILDNWNRDENDGLWKSEPVISLRNEKTPEVITLAVATDKHQATTELIYKDIPVGKWTNQKLSGGITPKAKETMLRKISQLSEAVRAAREEANTTLVEEVEVANALLGFVFADNL